MKPAEMAQFLTPISENRLNVYEKFIFTLIQDTKATPSVQWQNKNENNFFINRTVFRNRG